MWVNKFLGFVMFSLLLSQTSTLDQAEKILEDSGLSIDQLKSINQRDINSFKNQLNQTSGVAQDFDLKNDTQNDKSKIITDLEQIDKSNKSINEPVSSQDNNTTLLDDSIDEKEMIDNDQNYGKLDLDDITYFGYNTFFNDPEIFQKSNEESIDPNYVIGPGDEIVIMVWGDTQFNNKYIVSRDGYVFINDIGQVFVNGLNLNDLELKLFGILKKVYSSLDPPNGDPTSFFDLSLGGLVLRPLRIFALGEVAQPGAYSIKASSTLFNSLYFFKGPTLRGSLRNVKLIRNSKEIKSIDFYDYLLNGKKVNDVRLLRDDVVFIPRRGKTVTVKGEIGRPAIYELKENETLKDLIKISGGLLNTTYMDRAQIDRIIPNSDRDKTRNNRTLIDINLKTANSVGSFCLVKVI